MAQRIKIERVTNANIYLDGASLLGRVGSFNAPTITFKQSEHNALGLNGSLEYYGGIDKLEGTLQLTSIDKDVLKKLSPFRANRVQVRSSVEEYQGGSRVAQVPSIVYLTLTPKSIPTGNYQRHDNVEMEIGYSCTYIKHEVGGETLIEIDVEANIFKINGVDELATYRQNLGI